MAKQRPSLQPHVYLAGFLENRNRQKKASSIKQFFWLKISKYSNEYFKKTIKSATQYFFSLFCPS